MLNIFRKAGIFCLGFSLLWTLSSCSAVKDAHLKDSSVSAGSEQPPAWVTQRTHPIYPSAFYLIGVGFSDKGSNEADDAARLDLLKQIEVEIKGEESAVQTESSQSGSNKSSATNSSTYVQTRVESTVHMTVPGLRIEERWMDSTLTRYYSLAVLDREDASERLYRQITDMQKKINALVNAGEEAEGRRDYSGAVSRYQEAVNYIGSVQSLISPYNAISSPIGVDGSISHRQEYSFTETEADLKIRIERLSGKVIKSSEPVSWEDGIRDLILQMVSRLPAEGLLTVIVGDFREGRSGGRVPLSGLIESDIRTTMAGVEDIKVLEGDQATPDLLLTGLFRMDQEVLRINATIKDKKTGVIMSAGRVLIRAGEIDATDLMPHASEKPGVPPFSKGEIRYPPLEKGGKGGFERVFPGDSFDIAVEQVLTAENSAAPFSVNVRTDKKQVRIGEPLTFYLRADRDCYVTLFDQGTSGTLRVIFPNPYQRDNFIRAGKTYTVPDPVAGYEIRVDGPSGIERVKAIATLNKSDQPPLDISRGFYELATHDDDRIRDLNISVKKLPDPQWAEGSLELNILETDGAETLRPRRIKPKRPDTPVDIIGTPGVIDKKSPGVIEPKQPEKPVDILGVPGVKFEGQTGE